MTDKPPRKRFKLSRRKDEGQQAGRTVSPPTRSSASEASDAKDKYIAARNDVPAPKEPPFQRLEEGNSTVPSCAPVVKANKTRSRPEASHIHQSHAATTHRSQQEVLEPSAVSSNHDKLENLRDINTTTSPHQAHDAKSGSTTNDGSTLHSDTTASRSVNGSDSVGPLFPKLPSKLIATLQRQISDDIDSGDDVSIRHAGACDSVPSATTGPLSGDGSRTAASEAATQATWHGYDVSTLTSLQRELIQSHVTPSTSSQF